MLVPLLQHYLQGIGLQNNPGTHTARPPSFNDPTQGKFDVERCRLGAVRCSAKFMQ